MHRIILSILSCPSEMDATGNQLFANRRWITTYNSSSVVPFNARAIPFIILRDRSVGSIIQKIPVSVNCSEEIFYRYRHYEIVKRSYNTQSKVTCAKVNIVYVWVLVYMVKKWWENCGFRFCVCVMKKCRCFMCIFREDLNGEVVWDIVCEDECRCE